jgi:alpha-mannosidase II
MGSFKLAACLLAAQAAQTLSSTPLTVHIIPHSHCDPGWLESFEGYYLSQVARILSSVISELSEHPARRFVWAETSFWMRWYEVQSEEEKARVKSLVDSGQLEFVGGGWVQNDEANPDPISVISQLTEGHEYLQALFGKRPRIAWQIDP